MKRSRRLFSAFLALAIALTLFPVSSLTASAAFSGALQFDQQGKFTVMQVADIQESTTVNSRVITLLQKAIARFGPDLVVFTGDNQTGGSLTYKTVINKFLQPLLDTNTKYAVTFGNHDDEGWPSVSKSTQYDYYISHGGNLAIDHDVDALSGVGSGVIPIYPYGQSSGTPAFQVFLMDSGTYASSGYDCPYTDQIDYYIQRSQTYPNVPSLWYMHIIVPDIYTRTMLQVPSGTANSYTGSGSPFNNYSWILDPAKIDWTKSSQSLSEIYKEPPCPADQSTYTAAAHRSSAVYGSKTLYEAWAAYGNLLGAYFGHDHKNSFVMTTDDGIHLGYGKAPTLNSYNDGNPGLRIFHLDVNGTYTSQSVTEADIDYIPVAGDYSAVNAAIANARVMDGANVYYRANNVNDPAYYKPSSITVGDGVYAPSYFVNDAAGLTAAIGAVNYNLDSTQQATIDGYASAINNAWNALSLKTADYSAVDAQIAKQQGNNILAPPYYDATHAGQYLQRAYYLPATLSAWDAALNNAVAGKKLPDQTAVNAYAAALSSAHQALRLYSDVGYTVEYKCNGLSILPDKTVGGQTVASRVTETFAPVAGYTYSPDAGDIGGTKTLVLGLTNNIITFRYVPNTGTAYKIEHYFQNAALEGYDLYRTESKTGTTGSSATAQSLDETGFSFDSSNGANVQTGIVAADGSLVLKLYYTRNSYQMVFDAAGGSGTVSVSLPYQSPLEAPAVSREGYTFTGWTPEVPSAVPGENRVFTAAWQINSYEVVFDAAGGTGSQVLTMPFNAVITPPTVEKTGYSFSGWSPAVPQRVPAYNTRYTAEWIVNRYTAVFDAAGGNGGSETMYEFGAHINAPSVTRNGYTFAGWSPDVPQTMPANDLRFTAQWTLNRYTMTFNAGGGEGSAVYLLDYGSNLTPPSVTRNGFAFAGWSPAVPATVPATDMVFTAQWTQNGYVMTFDANGGTGSESRVCAFGVKLDAPAVARTGYSFKGWSPAVPETVPAADMTFTAQWEVNVYTVTFDANGGTGSAAFTLSYGAALSAPVVSRTGYTFAGWSQPVPTTVPAGDTTYTAVWAVNSYSIVFDAGAGSGSTSATLAYGSALIPPAVSRKGYTFTGWTPEVGPTVPASNMTYTAGWAINDYTVVFDANGGSGGATIVTQYGKPLAAPHVSRVSYLFAGWDPAVPAMAEDRDAVYTAQWQPINYKVSFDFGDGEVVVFQLHTSDEIVAPAAEKPGYTFSGWSPAPPRWVGTSDLYFYAAWAVNSYQITFDANGAQGSTGGTYVYGQALHAPVLTRTGYTFVGWTPELPGTVPASDTVYTAIWVANIHTVTFSAGGGTGGRSINVSYGDQIIPPAVQREGFIFAGWSPEIPGSMPDTPLFFTAVWTSAGGYQAVYLSGNSEVARYTVQPGDMIPVPQAPQKPGSIFLGWDPGIPAVMPAGDLTFTAQWFAYAYALSFDLNLGSGTQPETRILDGGAAVALPDGGGIARTGYRFTGWAIHADDTVALTGLQMPCSDLVLYAVWRPVLSLAARQGSSAAVHTDGLITGIEPGTSAADFENSLVEVLGDGRLSVIPGDTGFGTGTKIELIDNASGEVVSAYFILIYGDVNGDGNVDSADAGIIADFENFVLGWESGSIYDKAADINKDGNIDSADAGILVDYENYFLNISQTDGRVC